MKAEHIDRSDAKLDAIIRNRFSCSHMSNAKWVKLMQVFADIHPLIRQCRLKLIWDEELRELLIHENMSYGFDFYDTAMEALVSGHPRGWYSYKEIEWLDFPAHVHVSVNQNNPRLGTKEAHQDVEAIADEIRKVGQFDLKETQHGLTLFAYIRKENTQQDESTLSAGAAEA